MKYVKWGGQYKSVLRRNVKIVMKNHIKEMLTDKFQFKIFKFDKVYNILKIAHRRTIYKEQNMKIHVNL